MISYHALALDRADQQTLHVSLTGLDPQYKGL